MKPQWAKLETAVKRDASGLLKACFGAAAMAVVLLLAHAYFLAELHDRVAAGGLSDGGGRLLIQEDGLIEYLGAIAFFVASVLLFRAYRWLRKHRAPDTSRVKPYSLLALAILFFLAAGEEISWGQRIFGIQTPEALMEVNKQQETNLHNILPRNAIGGFDEYRLFTLAWYPYVILVPLLIVFWDFARRLTQRFLPTLALVAWPFGLLYPLNDIATWVVGQLLKQEYGFVPGIDYPRIELREALFAMLTVVTAYLLWRSVKVRERADDTAPSPATMSDEASRSLAA